MNQLCKVCGEPAAGFHFGAFTCEGCKSFFGRTYNNIAAIAGCKNNGDCVINKKNRTACKACRLRKCLLVGMSKSGSRYGRRSNWFKIHCLLQEQQQQSQHQHQQGQTTNAGEGGGGGGGDVGGGGSNQLDATLNNNNSFEQLARLHQMQVRQTYQDKTNPCIKTAAAAAAAAASTAVSCPTPTSMSTASLTSTTTTTPTAPPTSVHSFLTAAKFLNGLGGHTPPSSFGFKLETRLSDTPSDSGASSATADDTTDECALRTCNSRSSSQHQHTHSYTEHATSYEADASALANIERERRREKFLQIFRSHSEPLRSPFAPYVAITTPLPPPPPTLSTATAAVAAATLLKEEFKRLREKSVTATTVNSAAVTATATTLESSLQDEPIDLSVKFKSRKRVRSRTPSYDGDYCKEASSSPTECRQKCERNVVNLFMQPKTNPLDLTLSGTPTILTTTTTTSTAVTTKL